MQASPAVPARRDPRAFTETVTDAHRQLAMGWNAPCGHGVRRAAARSRPWPVPQPERGVLRLIEMLLPRRAAAARPPAPGCRSKRSELCSPLPRAAAADSGAWAATTTPTRPNWPPPCSASRLPKEHAWPMVFTKFAECVIGPHDTVKMPGRHVSVQIDYESELAVVIGRRRQSTSRARGRWTMCAATPSSTT